MNITEQNPAEECLAFEADEEFDSPPYREELRRQIIGWHVRNIFEHPVFGNRAAPIVLEWLAGRFGSMFKLDIPDLNYPPEIEELSDPIAESKRRRHLRNHSKTERLEYFESPALIKEVKCYFSQFAAKPQAEEDLLQRNITIIGKELGLSQAEADLVCLIERCSHTSELDDLLDDLINLFGSVSTVLACVFGIAKTNAHRLFMPSSLLIKGGIVRFNRSATHFSGNRGAAFQILNIFSRCMLRPYTSLAEMQGDLLGTHCLTDLVWSDFEHLGNDAEFALKLVRGAIEKKVKGVNILLYGPPGTGKTEFAKVLAEYAGSNLISIGETDAEGDEADRLERLGQLSLAQHLLHKSSNTILLMDEMEELVPFEPEFGRHMPDNKSGSLVYLHRILEETPVPVIWTANHIQSVRSSVLRRMMNALEFKIPPASVRAQLWSRMLNEANVDISEVDVKKLATEFEASPGILSNAVAATRCTDGGIDDLRHAAFQIVKTSQGGVPIRPKSSHKVSFNQKLLNADADLERLTEAIREGGSTSGVSLCLYGPPGTGKTAYIRFLASEMGVEVLQKRASDLLSKWVGGSEKSIARAFDEARASGKFLVFDEADSLLRDRSGADHSWEVTQVNEMLTWMEVHDYPFACTTNLFDCLDKASLRRFTFKVGFNYLSGSQARLAFTHYFGHEAPPHLSRIDCLTPGDFTVVQEKARILKIQDDPNELLQMLEKEDEIRHGAKIPIGFINSS
jgi:transitional endoplasmic reticulum ATPase